MKAWLVAFAVLGWMFAAAPAHADEDCDMKTVEQGKYCKDCGKLLEKDDLASDGDCKQCDKKPLAVKVCVKKYYECKCGKTYPKAGRCCGEKTTEKIDKARIVFKCSGCNATGDTRDAVSHDSECKKKNVKEACSKSGTKPHSKESPKSAAANDTMTPYRTLADDAFKAFKAGDTATAKKKAKELEKAWDTTGKSELASNQALWKTIDTAMDVFIEPLTKGPAKDASKVEAAYKEFITQLNKAAK